MHRFVGTAQPRAFRGTQGHHLVFGGRVHTAVKRVRARFVMAGVVNVLTVIVNVNVDVRQLGVLSVYVRFGNLVPALGHAVLECKRPGACIPFLKVRSTNLASLGPCWCMSPECRFKGAWFRLTLCPRARLMISRAARLKFGFRSPGISSCHRLSILRMCFASRYASRRKRKIS